MEQADERLRADLSNYYCFLGVIEGDRGHYEQAETYFQQAINACNTYGPKDWITCVISLRALMWLTTRPEKISLEELDQALKQAQEVGGYVYSIFLYRALALLELGSGNTDKAGHFAENALQLAKQWQAQNRQAETLTVLARIALACGSLDACEQYLNEANP